MGASDRYANAASALLVRQGDAQAQAQAASGQLWADTTTQLGNLASGTVQQVQAQHAAAQDEATVRALFANGTPSANEIIRTLGPERGIKIINGLAAMKFDAGGDYEKQQKLVQNTMLGLQALPPEMRAEAYPGIRDNLVRRKLIPDDESVMPRAYSEPWLTQQVNFGKEPPKVTEPADYTLDGVRYSGKTNLPIAGTPKANDPKTAPELAVDASNPDSPTAARSKAALELIQGPEQTRIAIEQANSARMAAAQQETARHNHADELRAAQGAVPGANTGGLDESGLELAATRFRLTGALPARDSKQNAAIMNTAAKQSKDLGQAPVVTIQKQAAYKGDAAALGQMQKMSASAEAFENKANAQIPIINDLSAKVPRTSMPAVNRAVQEWRTEVTGDTNASQLANAIETFSEEYAKIMTGTAGSSGGASDSARAASKRLVNTAMSKGTMADVLALMQREMGLTMQGYDATIQHITGRMMGAGAPSGAPSAAPSPTGRFNPVTGQVEPINAR